MTMPGPDLCEMCFSTDIAGEVRFIRVFRRPPEPWREDAAVSSVSVCAACLKFVNQALSARPTALSKFDQPEEPSPHGAGRCDLCLAELGVEAHVVEVVPGIRRYVQRADLNRYIARHVGPIRKNRVCWHCYLWCQSIVDDSWSMRGANARRGEGPPGEWSWQGAVDTVSAGLARADAGVLQRTIEAMGMVHTFLRPEDIRAGAGSLQTPLFLGCSRSQTARRLLEGMPPHARASVILVARGDATADAEAGLVLGAGDLLASPLSPHQVVGAVERILTGGIAAPTRLGVPRHLLRVQPGTSADTMAVYLALRRFLRGFDHVGFEAGGTLLVSLYCPAGELPAVTRRVSSLLKKRATVAEAQQTDARGQQVA